MFHYILLIIFSLYFCSLYVRYYAVVNVYAISPGSHIQSLSLPLQVLYVVASFPMKVTLAGFNGAKTVVLWSLDTTKSVLHHLPVKTCLQFFSHK